MVPPKYWDRKTTVEQDYQSTKPYLEPPPPYTTPTNSFSSVYYDPPTSTHHQPIDKIDDHIEVFELTFGSNKTATKDFEFSHPPVDNNDILKDYYIGDSTRRPNSYFYDEVSDGEMKESITQMTRGPTPSPDLENPLPTYKTYTDQYQTEVTTTPTTTTTTQTTTTTYFPSTEPTRRFSSPPLTTFSPYFTAGVTTSSSTVRLGTTPAIRLSTPQTTTYDPLTFGKVKKEKDEPTRSFSKVYQQLGGPVSINVTHPDEKSWERLVTLKPELNRNEEIVIDNTTPVSISTTQSPSTTTTSHVPMFVTSPSWSEEDMKMKKKPQMDHSAPDTGILTTRRNFTTRTEVEPLAAYLETPKKTKAYSYNSGIQWGNSRPHNKEMDPIKMSIKRNYKKKFQGGKRRNGVTKRPNWLKRKTTISALKVTSAASNDVFGDNEAENIILTPAPPTLKSKLPPIKFPTTTSATKSPAKKQKFDISKTLNKIIENSSTLTTTRPHQFVTNNVWTGTRKPPPRGITTPGWHIHSNADLRNRRKHQRSKDGGEDSVTANSKINNSKIKMPSLSKEKILKKIDKMKEKKAELRGRSLRKPYNPRPKMLRFTAEDAMEQTSGEVTADSRSYISIAPYNNYKRQISRQREIVLPEKSARRMDGGNRRSEASYKITPNLRNGGYKISPIRSKFQAPRRPYQDARPAVRSSYKQGQHQRNFNKDHSWLLKSPDGIEFHFQSLKQIYDLNQNNFVPG